MKPSLTPQLKPLNASRLNLIPTNSNFLNPHTISQSKYKPKFYPTFGKKKFAKLEGQYTMTDDERNWNLEILKNKRILNKSVYLTGFGDVAPFANPPIFSEAQYVFLIHNYKHFLYHWLTPQIFPNKPIIYLKGDPCDREVLERGFKMRILTEDYLIATKYSPHNSNISEITEEEFEKIFEDYEEEDMLAIKY